MIERITEYTEKIMKYKTYLNPEYLSGKYSDQADLNKVLKFYDISVNSRYEIFKIEFAPSFLKN